ncbi:PREDICTED: F-box only protein 17 isoform X3 [Rhinopithecus bieti]|uniref:F-box only protein 17 isoform X3 n=1 Tax=Rhinopithecus bieti TaxID=61621 RepID=UPI00083BFE31|nr:PREDICTED: F-box only protein 17 isoform X3 [Rhinopithecus bieti]
MIYQRGQGMASRKLALGCLRSVTLRSLLQSRAIRRDCKDPRAEPSQLPGPPSLPPEEGRPPAPARGISESPPPAPGCSRHASGEDRLPRPPVPGLPRPRRSRGGPRLPPRAKWGKELSPPLPPPSSPPGLRLLEMGARLSRRRLPADPSLALDALPPELLVQVLSHVPPRALVTRCRPVCRAWRDIVDGPTVWLLQLARDRSAEGRALYAVAQRCLPSNEDKEEFPLCALARYCLRAPFRRNLIFNSCGEQGFRGWEVEHGGNGWAIEKNLTPVPGAPSQTCFVTSFEWCSKRQLVDLVMEGVWQELLDSAQIEICVADWFCPKHSSSSFRLWLLHRKSGLFPGALAPP